MYQLAEVVLQVDGVDVKTVAVVSNTLPVSVLLGTDVPVLNCLLQSNRSSMHTRGVEEALVVMTRPQSKREKMKRKHRQRRKRSLAQGLVPLRRWKCGQRRMNRQRWRRRLTQKRKRKYLGAAFQKSSFRKRRGRDNS